MAYRTMVNANGSVATPRVRRASMSTAPADRDTASAFPFAEEAVAMVAAPRETVFAFLDDPNRVAGHMSERSWWMAGSTMKVDTDAGRGRHQGSRTRLAGRALGMRLFAQTEVLQRDPPRFKSWRTTGPVRLLVIGAYQMSITLDRVARGSHVTIRIDYTPPGGRAGALRRWAAHAYARWCVRRIADDVVAAFACSYKRKDAHRT